MWLTRPDPPVQTREYLSFCSWGTLPSGRSPGHCCEQPHTSSKQTTLPGGNEGTNSHRGCTRLDRLPDSTSIGGMLSHIPLHQQLENRYITPGVAAGRLAPVQTGLHSFCDDEFRETRLAAGEPFTDQSANGVQFEDAPISAGITAARPRSKKAGFHPVAEQPANEQLPPPFFIIMRKPINSILNLTPRLPP